MPIGKKLAALLFRVGERSRLFNAARKISPNVLTVLNYHRVDVTDKFGFDSFSSNVSAYPGEFERQLEYIGRYYNVISCGQLNEFRLGKKKLPPFPLMVTFDDGYFDNYSNAYPLLQKAGYPAVIFLSTDHIGSDLPFYWDYVAYCFHHSNKTSAVLPFLGMMEWDDEYFRRKLISRWVHSIKYLAENDKQQRVLELASILEVKVPDGVFAPLKMNWDQVRELSQNGIEMGAHTMTHPILTRIPLSQVKTELVGSKEKIEKEIGKPVIAFAYPNGGYNDYSTEIVELVKDAGFDLAFTLVNGVSRFRDINANPLTIRRIYLGQSDSFPRFEAKLAGYRFIN